MRRTRILSPTGLWSVVALVALLLALTQAAPLQGHERRESSKKSLFRGKQASFRALKANKLKQQTNQLEVLNAVTPSAVVLAASTGTATSQFCSRFLDACTSVCTKAKLRVTVRDCSMAGSMSNSRTGFNFRCTCSNYDYTAPALLASTLPASTSTVTSVSTLTTTRSNTMTSTSLTTQTTVVTTNVENRSTSTTWTNAFTTLPASTSTVTRSTTLQPSTVARTTTTTLPVLIVTKSTTTTLPTRSTSRTSTVRSPTTVTATMTVTAPTSTVYSTTTVTVADNQTGNYAVKLAASNEAASLKATTQVKATTSDFCSLYNNGCGSSCRTRGGISSQSCAASSTNVYALKCLCRDGSSQTQHALVSAQANPVSVVANRVAVQTIKNISTQVAVSTATTTRQVQIVAHDAGVTITKTSLQTVQPATTYVQTIVRTLSPGTTYTRVSTLTLNAPRTSTTTQVRTQTPSVATVTVTTTLRPTVTVRTTTTTTPLRSVTSTTTTTTKAPSPTASLARIGKIAVTNLTSSQQIGVVSTHQDSSAYAFVLAPSDSTSGRLLVSPVQSGSYIGLNISNADEAGVPSGFSFFGLETQAVNDNGVQPVTYEFLLMTDTASSSTPAKANSDTGSFWATSNVWSMDSNSALTATWINPSGSSPASNGMSLYVICTDVTAVSSCFLTAAAGMSTWAQFNTDGITISPVSLQFQDV